MRIGNFLLETHFHTAESSSCGRVPAEVGISQYIESGYDGVVVTDHFSKEALGGPGAQSWEEVTERFLRGYEAARNYGEGNGITVYLGMEIRFPGNEDDILVYGISRDFLEAHPWLYLEDAAFLRSAADENKLFTAQAHPFRAGCQRVNPALLNGLEVLNGHPRHDSRNAMAEEWAVLHNLLPLAGSDYHQYGDVSGYGILLEGRPESEQQLAQWLLSRNYRMKR